MKMRGQLDQRRHRVFAAVIQIGGVFARQACSQGGHDGLLRHAQGSGLAAVHQQNFSRRIGDGALVHIHHAFGFLEHRTHGFGHLATPFSVRPINFGHDGRHHRGAGRHLDHLDVGPVTAADLLQSRTHAGSDHMALVAAIGFTHQVNLDVPQLSACTQVVLAHQAVEVDGRSGADIGLVMRDLGHRGQVTTQLAHDGRCFFQRRACGHVHHHLELRLVVKGQHLEHDQTGRRQDQRQGNQTGNAQTQQLAVAPARLGVEQRLENFFEQGFEFGAQAGVASCRVMRMTSQRLHPHARQPGCDDKGNGQ